MPDLKTPFTIAMLGLVAMTASVFAHADDLGKKSFELCVACHSLQPGENGLGPSLHQLIGRAAGTLEGFRFSGPMKRSGIVWDRTTLTAYLRNPQESVAGTRMPFSGMSDEAALQALVAYLEQSSK
jgi:cytochrome c